MAFPNKRLILCCDGTWMDSDDGFQKPTLIPYVPTGSLQVPSNVTRISRALGKHGLDGKPQIIFYHSGVGTGSSLVDTIAGGLLGTGISENIREVYSFITANYVPGDEIILIGFSRGAFTVRSVAGMIKDIGLLTRDGMTDFYPIFKDQENFKNRGYKDIFPTIPFSDKPRGPEAAHEYKRRLEQAQLTRVYDPDGSRIRVQAVAVWDTVGSLGIPNISLLAKFGLPHSTKEYKFYDTNLSGNIKHAFQALALDEHRAPFAPAVWERNNKQKVTVDLRQVWFPGAHSNVGGGYDDQEIANITLAWMMDQLASISVAFQDEFIDQIFNQNVDFYENPPRKPPSLTGLLSRKNTKPWARQDIYEKYKPVRPWALGKIYESETGIWLLAGKKCRTPGLNTRSDPETGSPTDIPLTHTNERIHSCVRVRLDMDGLDLDDKGLYKCHALLDKGPWELRQVRIRAEDPIPYTASWGPGAPAAISAPDDRRWIWEYVGPEETAPEVRFMLEDNLGPYERKLLLLNKVREDQQRRKRRRRKSRKRESMYDVSQFRREKPSEDLAFEYGKEYVISNREIRSRRRRSSGNRDSGVGSSIRRDSMIDERVESRRVYRGEEGKGHRRKESRGEKYDADADADAYERVERRRSVRSLRADSRRESLEAVDDHPIPRGASRQSGGRREIYEVPEPPVERRFSRNQDRSRRGSVDPRYRERQEETLVDRTRAWRDATAIDDELPPLRRARDEERLGDYENRSTRD